MLKAKKRNKSISVLTVSGDTCLTKPNRILLIDLSNPASTLKKRPHRLRKNQVLLREHAGRQRLGTVTWQYRHHRLRQDGTVVQLGRHLVHGRARHLTTGINGALDHL